MLTAQCSQTLLNLKFHAPNTSSWSVSEVSEICTFQVYYTIKRRLWVSMGWQLTGKMYYCHVSIRENSCQLKCLSWLIRIIQIRHFLKILEQYLDVTWALVTSDLVFSLWIIGFCLLEFLLSPAPYLPPSILLGIHKEYYFFSCSLTFIINLVSKIFKLSACSFIPWISAILLYIN